MARQRRRLSPRPNARTPYLEIQRWQFDGIRAAIEEADRGEPGVQPERVAAWIDSWGAAGLTQRSLPRMGTTQSVIAPVEAGRVQPTTATLPRLARATGTCLKITFERAGAES